ncbi:MAG TPA: PfkB family carbohydrate kinase [Chroococcales cyanobacterium]|jgi:1-phosphofructokinase
MIGIISPALAVDIMVEIEGEEVLRACFHPGGQGVNVARVVLQLEQSCRLVGFNGGESGIVLAALLEAEKISAHLVRSEHSTAAVFKITSDYSPHQTLQTLPPKVSRHEVDDLFSIASLLILESKVVVINGSLPRGMPSEVLVKLIKHAVASGVPVVLDLAGEDLLAALPAGPTLIKPNLKQLLPFFEVSASPTEREVLALAHLLRSRGAQNIVISLDGRGGVALSQGGAFLIQPPRLESMSEPGAGDSMVAAFAVGLHQGLSFPEILRLGAAAGSASVLRHGLGTAKREVILRLLDFVRVIPLED